MATGLKSCFRLSGSLDRPPYPFPAGFNVTKMPEFGLTGTFFPISSNYGC